LHTLGTKGTTQLSAITFGAATPVGATAGTGNLNAADLASISNGIVGDVNFAATNPTGILATATTAGTKTLTALVHTAGMGLGTIQVGALVVGTEADIVPGTFVTDIVSGTSVHISVNAVSSTTLRKIAFINPGAKGMGGRLSFEGRLELPGGRGWVTVKPGDVIAIDSTGWPILVSAAAIAYSGSDWTYT